MNYKKILPIVTIIIALMLSGCEKDSTSSVTQLPSESTFESEALNVEDMFSERDKQATFDRDTAVMVNLANETVTLSKEGTYIVAGSIADGQIIVEATKEAKIQIVLDGVNITSSSSAAIYIKQADKVFLTLAENSVNKLGNENGFTADGDTNVDGVIFSKDDLTINGNGSLQITSSDHGIVSKDDLVITSGNIKVDAASHAVSAKDSIRICGGEFDLTAGKDGFHADNSEDTALGYVYVSDGTFFVDSKGDGFDASAKLQIDGGAFSITAGGGAENAPESFGNDFGIGHGGSFGSAAETDSVSTKGIKSAGALIITMGSVTIDSADDAIHSNASLEVRGGNFDIKTGDDGLHADEALYISGGKILIHESYEGLEGISIDIVGGDIDITASDDGLNAAGGNDQSGFGGPGGNMRPDAFGSSSDSWIRIVGGKLNIDADGDGVDSNGALYVSGGETYVSGPTNSGNGALDYGSVAEISGGLFVATGALGMSENFTSGSTQGAIMLNVRGGANVTVILKNSKGEKLLDFTPQKVYSSVVLSHPNIEKGERYTVIVGENTYELEMSEIIYGQGSAGGMGGPGGMGGRPGGRF